MAGNEVTAAAHDDVVLCVNSGSSSLKFAVFVVRGETFEAVVDGAVEGIGLPQGNAWLRAGTDRQERHDAYPDHASAFDAAFALLRAGQTPAPSIVGHRIVHGGTRYREPVRIDDAVLRELRTLVRLAPLHMPAAIAGIEGVALRLPDVPQIGCFDTAFHATLPEIARRLPLPERFNDAGIRRYGFHGISYEYVMSTLGDSVPRRVILAHLGNGSSLVAVRDGRAVDTTMGLTPTGGIVMGTRAGDLDPGVLIHLLREQKLSADDLERLLVRESGLIAIGGTSDVKELVRRAGEDERARLALSMFGYAVRKAIGSFVAVLGGADLLVFTGGIGEHAAEVRREACRGLEAMGIELDDDRNTRGLGVISADASRCTVRIIPTNEDLMIARHVRQVVRENVTSSR